MSLILFEDEHLLVINKPAGWNTHAPGPFAGEGVYDWLKHRQPRWSNLAILHRLDKETSGVMVFGKTSEANRSLTQQFASRAVRKRYLLLTDRTVPRKEFTVVSAIVRAGDKYASRPAPAGGERAETRFTTCRRLATGGITPTPELPVANRQHVLLEAEPVTGRTHQIRVHAAEHGFPILGDTLYGGTKAGRVFLHAAELSLKHPATGAALSFCAPCDWIAESRVRADLGVRAPDALRAAVIEPPLTNAFRLLHGASDGWPGLYVDKLGEFLLAQSASPPTNSQREWLGELAGRFEARGAYHKLLQRTAGGPGMGEGCPRLLLGEAAPERFLVRENGLTFELSFSEGYSVGLFLDQRDNRRRFLVNHVAADFPLFPNGAAGAEVLNAFAYTCGFSVAAAQAGARTTSLDLSKKYLEWGRRHFRRNGLAEHDFICGDAFDWLRRLSKKGRAFDCVVLDPPTFSRSKESGTWQAEKDYGKLVEAALPVLKPNGILFASTNAARLEAEEFLEAIDRAVTRSRRRILQRHYAPQPPDFPIAREEPAYLKTVWLRVS